MLIFMLIFFICWMWNNMQNILNMQNSLITINTLKLNIEGGKLSVLPIG